MTGTAAPGVKAREPGKPRYGVSLLQQLVRGAGAEAATGRPRAASALGHQNSNEECFTSERIDCANRAPGQPFKPHAVNIDGRPGQQSPFNGNSDGKGRTSEVTLARQVGWQYSRRLKMAIQCPKPVILSFVLGLSVAATAVHAQDQSQPSLSIDLNATQQLEQTCRLVFVAANKTNASIDEMSLETVLFDASGTVDRFALFDFKDLPVGKTRVRQFDLPDTRCTDIGRILINGAASCKGASLKGTECMDHLDLKSSSKTEIVG